jgi:hypothetical protein
MRRRATSFIALPLALLTTLLVSAAGAQPAPRLTLELPEPGGVQERPPHLARALVETAGLLLGGTVWYWRDLDFNARDWDLRWDVPSWRSKLSLASVRFDQNLFQTNAVSHPRAGFAHYQVARGNGLGLFAATGTVLATSVLWEYLAEFKEQPSLNDMVVNTTAGMAIGEPLYQLGEFFLRSRPSLLSRGLGAALSPVAAMNDCADRRTRPSESSDSLGLTREAAHRFELTAGYQQRSFDGEVLRRETGLAVGTELVTLPGYDRPGRFATFIAPGAWTSVTGRLDLGERGISGGALLTRAALLGRYFQQFERSSDGRLTGHGALLGLGTAFDYEDSGRPGGADYLAVMNVVGPLFELLARGHGVRLRLSGELYGDFAMVKSLAFEGRLSPMTGSVYRPGETGGRIPGVLGARGYYYALGVTGGTRLDLESSPWDLGASLRADHFDSIAGLDRFRDEMMDEYDLIDQRVIANAWLGVRPFDKGPRLSTGVQWRWRRGIAEELSGEHLDLRLGLATSVVF